MGSALSFPSRRPAGYAWFDDEPVFDPARHLQVEPPGTTTGLAELGYSADEIAPTATPVAFSGPFRVLSDEGAAVLLDVARRLRGYAVRAGDRIENTVRGGCYRSRWLRDLCCSPEVTGAMSDIYGTGVAPHTMPVHLGHLNYEPSEVGVAVDKWHHDTIPLDFVMMVSDPSTLPGGRFEVFMGTRQEAAALAAAGERPPIDRVLAPDFPGPGWAIALHGNMVVHRGAPLDSPAERITMVNAYVALDRTGDDQSRSRDLIGVDDPEVLYAEWVRHVTWRAAGRLESLGDSVPFGIGPGAAAEILEEAVVDVLRALDEMRAGPVGIEHYE
ncbi:MAG: hypothetical protein VX752_07415 [Actinomycetota bacterium]|jgi:hypothetical protein|nr:hypothetical protein [Actinomycetota bacterium]MEE2631866.1 hypothetical protein [Actinomycetota bacterium]